MNVQTLIKQLQKLPLQSRLIIGGECDGVNTFVPLKSIEEGYYEDIYPYYGHFHKDKVQENLEKCIVLKVVSDNKKDF